MFNSVAPDIHVCIAFLTLHFCILGYSIYGLNAIDPEMSKVNLSTVSVLSIVGLIISLRWLYYLWDLSKKKENTTHQQSVAHKKEQ